MQDDETGHIERTGPKELGWFVLLWGLGVASVTAIGGVIKLFLG